MLCITTFVFVHQHLETQLFGAAAAKSFKPPSDTRGRPKCFGFPLKDLCRHSILDYWPGAY